MSDSSASPGPAPQTPAPPGPDHPTPWRALLLVVVGAVVIGGAVWLGLDRGERVAVKPDTRVTPAPSAAASAAPASHSVRPSFDIVRVNPEGDAVIAGRAAPGSRVTIKEGDRVLGTTEADRNGEFVFVPTERLPAGARELTLSARTPDGAVASSDGAVLLVVPDLRNDAAGAAVAVLTPEAAAPRLLQGRGQAGPATLGVEAAATDEQGTVRLSGSAPPGASVRLYLDDKPVGEAIADATGHWTLTPPGKPGPGAHELRVDQIAPNGAVAARVDVPLQHANLPTETLASGHVAVERGHSLWRLAERLYGSGLRYTIIYEANREQVRDPDKIYPGQVLALPAAAAGMTPSSSSKSR